MTGPEFWGWSTGPLSIVFWGWEDAVGLSGLERAPRVVHSVCPVAGVSVDARQCKRSTAGKEAKSVSGRPLGVVIAGDDKVPGLSVVHATGRVSNCSFIPKAQGRACVDKRVKEKATVPPVESAAVETGRGVPNISS